MAEEVDQDDLSMEYLSSRFNALNTTVTNLGNHVTTLNNNVADRVTVVEGDAINLTDRVTVVEGDAINLTDRVTTVEGNANNLTARAATTEAAVDGIVQGITTFGASVNGAPGPAGSLLGRYKEAKKTLIKERAEVIDGYEKAVNRLDPIHFASLTVVVLLFAFNVWFYNHMPDVGEKMKPAEFGGRFGLIILVTIVLLGFMWLLFMKISHIRGLFLASRRRFQELSNIFKGLSKTRLQRQADIDDAPAGEVRINIADAYAVADDYDELQPESLIPSFEVTRFRVSTLEKKPPMPSVYLWGTVVIVSLSAALMIVLIIRDVLKNGGSPPPAPGGVEMVIYQQ